MASPLPAYPAITRGTLRQSLLDRLDSAQFWSVPELNIYLSEALTCFQAHARYWKQRVTFNTHLDGAGNSQLFYDLTQEIPQLAQTSTDAQLLSQIEYHLIEPQSGIPAAPAWAGTAMFPADAYTDALTRRRDRFLLDTHSVIGHFSATGVSAGSSRVVLPSSIIDVRRVAFLDATNTYTNLWRDDEFAANAFDTSWGTTVGTPPTTYSVISTPPYTLALIPPPGDVGSLDLLAIAQGPPLNPAVGIVLGTPDNYAWAIKYGAMADLLSQDGAGRDLQRAAYCEMRYQEGVQLCRIMPTVVNAAINENSTQLDSVFNFDAYSVNWHNTVGIPQFLGLAGQTMLATSCVPDPANPVGIALDVVVNAPIPTDDGTPLGITADVAEVLVDYAQHAAIFKSGGAEFQASLALHQGFVKFTKMYRDRSLAQAPYWPAMSSSDQLEFEQNMVILR
jgi:hypothetical protein